MHNFLFVTTLDSTDLVGNVKCSLLTLAEADVRLLLTVGADKSVHKLGLHVVHALHGVRDVVLVGADVNDEHKSVLVADLLDRRLGGQRVLQDGKLVHLVHLPDRHTLDLGLAGKTQGVGTTEVHRGADLLCAVDCTSLVDLGNSRGLLLRSLCSNNKKKGGGEFVEYKKKRKKRMQ